jgi:hypothetical protein
MRLTLENTVPATPGGLAGWLLARWRNRTRTQPRLELVERITLAPRQTLSLIEAEGQRILIASSPEGGPAFYPLGGAKPIANRPSGRISW